MKVGLAINGLAPDAADAARRAERLGADCLWSAETWTFDGFSGLAALALQTSTISLATGIAQLGARSPAMLAMSALAMDELSRGRFRLGIGVSGPGVVEGWHGVPFDRPLQRLRETIAILRRVFAGERLDHHGEVFDVPRAGFRPLRTGLPPRNIPIYVAALGPRSLELTGEAADGWLGNAFVPESADVFLEPIRRGARRAGRDVTEIDLVAPVAVEFGDDEELARKHADGYAFTIGAMGAGGRNFYNDAFTRLGFGDAVARVAQLWSERRREDAARAVPIELGAMTNLVGSRDTVAQRVAAYAAAGITSLQAKISGDLAERSRTLSDLVEIVSAV
jgi:F420-dependent oxidoreductase-like protein